MVVAPLEGWAPFSAWFKKREYRRTNSQVLQSLGASRCVQGTGTCTAGTIQQIATACKIVHHEHQAAHITLQRRIPACAAFS